MTIKELAQQTKWEDVRRALKYHYPKQKNEIEYKLAFDYIKKAKKPKKSVIEEGEVINVYAGNDSDIDFCDYYGIDIKKPDELETYSMSFIKWADLANMEVGEDTINHYTNTDILAHFIWEITWYGTEKQMRAGGKLIAKRAKEAMKEIKYKE